MNEYARVEHTLTCLTSTGAIALANRRLHLPAAARRLSRLVTRKGGRRG